VDRPFDDEARAEQQAERRAAAAESAGGPARPGPGGAERRSRSEYYDELWAADQGRSGWDEVAARDRPPPGRIRLSPERAGPILDGAARQDRVPGQLG
jgi:hypothetical protein